MSSYPGDSDDVTGEDRGGGVSRGDSGAGGDDRLLRLGVKELWPFLGQAVRLSPAAVALSVVEVLVGGARIVVSVLVGLLVAAVSESNTVGVVAAAAAIGLLVVAPQLVEVC
ncbi:hypothetical protein ACFPVT_03880 [Corynebacterium choanae]|uniref:Uncharacterized protein n=1 Tax=Corynebacterium choanae TaxID=1862358 RepID=A0A3G6J971_9CORY|nr:hypothetical protein [Corynebacterium choanae]AZA14323.1 hypothetical protein CCHOA_09700 [Corynebacterium choanae]